MRDRPSVGMVRIFNIAMLKKMKNMGVEREKKYKTALVGDKYYTNKKLSAYIQRVDRTLSSGGSGEPEELVRHFYYYNKDTGGNLMLCVTDAQIKQVIIKLDDIEREFFFIRYVLENKCAQLVSKLDFENPEMLMRSIVKAVDDFLDSRYRNYEHIRSFTSENINKWKGEDEKPNSSYNYIRTRMINELGMMVRQSSQPLRF